MRKPVRRFRPWSLEELGRFLDSTSAHRFGPLFRVYASTGLRRGEALGLRWADVDLTARVLVVRQQLGHATACAPPEAGGRVVKLDDHTVGALLEQQLRQSEELQQWGSDDLVFAREKGEPIHPEQVTKTFRRLAIAAGLRPISLHGLRHASAS